MSVAKAVAALTEPDQLVRRADALRRPSPIPPEPGLYGWYFREVPPKVPGEGCLRRGGGSLLYVGISPSRPGVQKQNLRTRIRTHLSGNASGSTLRLSLGCLLSELLGIRLQRVGKRLHFGPGEKFLDTWLEENALVCWTIHERPWEVEHAVISHLDLPLNLRGNKTHPFADALSSLRRRAAEGAG